MPTTEQKRELTVAGVFFRAANKSKFFDEVEQPTSWEDGSGTLFAVRRNGHTYHVKVSEYC